MTAAIVVNDSTGDTMSPDLVLGYETARQSRNLVHDLIGGGTAVSLIMPRLRAGNLSLFFAAEAAAFQALAIHGREASFTLTDTDIPDIGMTYVLANGADVILTLDDATRLRWVLSVPYQEIVP